MWGAGELGVPILAVRALRFEGFCHRLKLAAGVADGDWEHKQVHKGIRHGTVRQIHKEVLQETDRDVTFQTPNCTVDGWGRQRQGSIGIGKTPTSQGATDSALADLLLPPCRGTQ